MFILFLNITSNAIIVKKIITINSFMITELNIYLSLFVAVILLAFTVRLGVSLYQ